MNGIGRKLLRLPHGTVRSLFPKDKIRAVILVLQGESVGFVRQGYGLQGTAVPQEGPFNAPVAYAQGVSFLDGIRLTRGGRSLFFSSAAAKKSQGNQKEDASHLESVLSSLGEGSDGCSLKRWLSGRSPSRAAPFFMSS